MGAVYHKLSIKVLVCVNKVLYPTHFGQSLYNRVLQHTLFIGATYCF